MLDGANQRSLPVVPAGALDACPLRRAAGAPVTSDQQTGRQGCAIIQFYCCARGGYVLTDDVSSGKLRSSLSAA